MFLNTTRWFATLLSVWLFVQGTDLTSQRQGLTAPGSTSAAPSQTQQLDTGALHTVEELSESLANDLLALSVAARDKDRLAIERFFAPELEADVLPTQPGELRSELKWIRSHEWHPDGRQAAPLGRAQLLNHLEKLLEHFSELEDVRFKVKGADFDLVTGDRGSARIWLYIVGRDDEGRREWLTSWLQVQATRSTTVDQDQAAATTGQEPVAVTAGQEPAVVTTEAAPWQIEKLDVESMSSMVTDTDLFSEVAVPAGVHRAFPAFGTAPNDTVVAHGVAVADINSDGLMDIATTGVEHNSLYLNDGRGGFRDISEESLVALSPAGSAALFVDVDNDGDSDLFLSQVGEQVLLENRWVPDGEITFLDRSLQAGVAVPATGFSAVAADANNDGWQDIYVASYNRYGLVMPNSWNRATNGTPNLFFLNQGDGTFREVAGSWGVQDSRWSYAAAFADYDEDGDQDLYVANDFGENGFYLNEGETFIDVATARNVLDPGNGMGVSFGDYDNDGDLDLHVTNMSSTAGNRILARLYPDAAPGDSVLKKLASGNSLFENVGNGAFRDVTSDIGGLSSGWAFGGGFLDFDNDGWEDLHSPNGFISGKTMNDT